VHFHDGRELDAEDAAFSLIRSAQITGSPGSYVLYASGIAGITVSDPFSLIIRTREPVTLLRQATELVIGDAGLIPLLFLKPGWAMRRPLTPNPVGNTYAWQFRADAATP